jgi:two-component system OmpR family sensor kinase
MSQAVRYSIRERLLVWLLGTLVVAGLLIGYSAYHRSQEDLNDLLDDQLKQLAFSLSRQSVGWAPAAPGMLPEPDFITQVWDKDGVLMFYSRPNLAIPMRPRPGFSNVDWICQSWRVLPSWTGFASSGSPSAQPAPGDGGGPDAPGSAAVGRLLPLLALGIWIIVGRALRPCPVSPAAVRARARRQPCSRCRSAIFPTSWYRWWDP